VREGRAIYSNTKQFIRYMISSNVGEVVAIFAAAALGVPEVLTPVQLLWVNLVTDGLPATALGFNRPDGDVMRRPPRPSDEPIVNGWLFLRYAVIGLYVGAATVAGFLWWFLAFEGGPGLTWAQLTAFQTCRAGAAAKAAADAAKAAAVSGGGGGRGADVPAAASTSPPSADCAVFRDNHPKTLSMTVLVIVEMFNALNNLSEDGSLLSSKSPPWANLWLLAAIAVSVALHCLIMYVPALASVFGITHLGWLEWRCVLVLSAPIILLDEAMKAWARRRRRTSGKGARRPRGGVAVAPAARRLALAVRSALAPFFGPTALRLMRGRWMGGGGEGGGGGGGGGDAENGGGAGGAPADGGGAEISPLLLLPAALGSLSGKGGGLGGVGGSGDGGGAGAAAADGSDKTH
jgi:P-type Ca2+ transporter type 2A